MNEKLNKTLILICCTLLLLCTVAGAGVTGYNLGTRQARVRLYEEYEAKSKSIQRTVEEFRESDERALGELRDVLERNDGVLRDADSFLARYNRLSEARDRCIQRLYDNSINMCDAIGNSLPME